MTSKLKTGLKFTAVALFLAGAAVWALGQFNAVRRSGEEGTRTWFYDQSEKQLYTVSRDTIPPHKGIGGLSGDGVRAVVVAFRSDQNDPRKRQIAYLETYSPELKNLLEQIQQARTAHTPFKGTIPSRDSDFYQNNTLVKLPTEQGWHPISTPEGQDITAQWRDLRGPDGQPPIVCVP